MRFLDTSAASPRKTASGTSSGGISTRPLARKDAVGVSRAPTSRVSRVSRERLARVGASASVSNVGFERAVATHGAFVRLARVGELAFEFSSMSPRGVNLSHHRSSKPCGNTATDGFPTSCARPSRETACVV